MGVIGVYTPRDRTLSTTSSSYTLPEEFLVISIKANHPETSDSSVEPVDAMRSAGDPELPEVAEVWSGLVDDVNQWWESLVAAV